jgi:predicted ATPase
MLFQVVPPRGSIRSSTYSQIFILRQDNWNDFSFQTLYQLYYAGQGHGEPALIGDVKILKKGQTAKEFHQVPKGTFSELDDSYCSIGQSLDYYERLAGLPSDIRDAALVGLRDIVRFPELSKKFNNEPGWSISLFRDVKENSEFIQLAKVLVDRDYSSLPSVDLNFVFEMAGWSAPFPFNFSVPDTKDESVDGWPKRSVSVTFPSRIVVIIGRNGSGKSTLLARLARIAHASSSERETDALRSLGTLSPAGIGFTRIVTISYSAFDSFQVPGVTRRDREQIARDIEEGSGRYVFCGLRNIAEELQAKLLRTGGDSLSSTDSDTSYSDREEDTLLKPLRKIASEFAQALEIIEQKNRNQLFRDALGPLLADPSFKDTTIPNILTESRADSIENGFMSWSTGHKIVLHVVSFLVAYTEPKSLVLFDEPESHLHPPLLAALMHSVRKILQENDAFAVISTHSPVVVQETMSRHVHVIRRQGDLTKIFSASIQTFGENIGTLTSEIFDLKSDVTDYHSILRELVAQFDTLEEIEGVFDGSLSMQGRAYVMSLIAQKGRAG